MQSDFFLLELECGRWTQISEDTAEVGGPRLMFDHQMVMDIVNRVIYVFGGRVLTQSRWEGSVPGSNYGKKCVAVSCTWRAGVGEAKVGWMDGVEVALGCRGMVLGTAQQCVEME